MFTSHYERERSFDETKDGSFDVVVHGDWMPRHIKGRLHIVFATARNLWLAARVAVLPTRFDVLICDQVCLSCFDRAALLCPTHLFLVCHGIVDRFQRACLCCASCAPGPRSCSTVISLINSLCKT